MESNETRLKEQSKLVKALYEAVHADEVERKRKYKALRTEIAERKRQSENTHTHNK